MSNFSNVVGETPGDPGGDPLYQGTQKWNDNFDLLRLGTAGFSSTLPLGLAYTRVNASTLPGQTAMQLPTDLFPGAICELMLTGGSIKWPVGSLLEVSGEYQPDLYNRILIKNVGGETQGTASLIVEIQNIPAVVSSGLVFRQDCRNVNALVTSMDAALSANENSGSPSSEILFSRMGRLEEYRQRDGFFYFRAKWFVGSVQTGNDIVWRQRSNPAEEFAGYEEVEDFEAISGQAQLDLVLPGETIPFSGLCLASINRYATWHGHPGSVENEAGLVATVGTTHFAKEAGVTSFTPGVSFIDNVFELRAEQIQ